VYCAHSQLTLPEKAGGGSIPSLATIIPKELRDLSETAQSALSPLSSAVWLSMAFGQKSHPRLMEVADWQ